MNNDREHSTVGGIFFGGLVIIILLGLAEVLKDNALLFTCLGWVFGCPIIMFAVVITKMKIALRRERQQGRRKYEKVTNCNFIAKSFSAPPCPKCRIGHLYFRYPEGDPETEIQMLPWGWLCDKCDYTSQ